MKTKKHGALIAILLIATVMLGAAAAGLSLPTRRELSGRRHVAALEKAYEQGGQEAYLKALAQRAPADWSAEARAWAEKTGLIAGDETGNKQYRGFLTREQFAVLLHRYARLTGEEKAK